MLRSYRTWLDREGYGVNVVNSRVSNVERIERFHGDLDEQFDRDRLTGLLAEFIYSTDDERRRKPNPTKIDFEAGANLRTGLATCRSALQLYRRFRLEADSISDEPHDAESKESSEPLDVQAGHWIALEQDMQNALRKGAADLEPGLTVVDGGRERKVASGFIDITAKDVSGALVVIELKAGIARRDAVAQILSYMGDLALEDRSSAVRGVLVAAEFDPKAVAAARVVPQLALRSYSITFKFTPVSEL
jgi:endonuclease